MHHRELDARGGGGGGGGVDFQGLEVERDRLSHVEGDAYRTHVRLSSTAGSRHGGIRADDFVSVSDRKQT